MDDQYRHQAECEQQQWEEEMKKDRIAIIDREIAALLREKEEILNAA